VAGAGTPEAYVATLREVGFSDLTVDDRRDALLDMVTDVRRKMLGIELAIGLGKLTTDDGPTTLAGVLDLNEGKRLARRAVELIESGAVSYSLIAATKPGSVPTAELRN
jgi:hypothetical protein